MDHLHIPNSQQPERALPVVSRFVCILTKRLALVRDPLGDQPNVLILITSRTRTQFRIRSYIALNPSPAVPEALQAACCYCCRKSTDTCRNRMPFCWEESSHHPNQREARAQGKLFVYGNLGWVFVFVDSKPSGVCLRMWFRFIDGNEPRVISPFPKRRELFLIDATIAMCFRFQYVLVTQINLWD